MPARHHQVSPFCCPRQATKLRGRRVRGASMTSQLAHELFKERLSFWLNGSLSEAEAKEMAQFLANNPSLEPMVTFERAIQASFVPVRSPLSAEESWRQLRPRLKLSVGQVPKPSLMEQVKEWLGFDAEKPARGWQLGFAMAVVCIVQAGMLVHLSQQTAEDEWGATRSGNAPTTATIRGRVLPGTDVNKLLEVVRTANLQVVSGPNAQGELMFEVMPPGSTDQSVQKLVASGVFEYVNEIKTRGAP